MTPRLRSLFEGTVEPLLEVARLQEEIAGREDAQATHRRCVEKAKAMVAQLKLAPKGKEQQQQIEQARQQLEKKSDHLKNAIVAASKLRAKLAQVRKRRALGPALEQLEGPIVEGSAEVADSSDDDSSDEDSSDDDNDSSSAGSDGAVGDGDVKPVSAAAPMAAATYSSSSASGSSSPAKKKAKAKKQQKPCSLLERFITEHHDPSSHVLGFLGGTALKGIGATARGLRKTVKNLLPTPSFSQNDSSTLPSLAAFPRLLQLALDCSYCQRSKQWASDLLLLDWNKRLESLAIWGKDPRLCHGARRAAMA